MPTPISTKYSTTSLHSEARDKDDNDQRNEHKDDDPDGDVDMNDINLLSMSDELDYGEAIMSISADNQSCVGTNKIGDRRLRWNTNESRVSEMLENTAERLSLRFTKRTPRQESAK